MNKKYIITLSESERKEMRALAAKPRFSKKKARNIHVLLGTDQGLGGKGMIDEELAKAYDLTPRSIRNIRKRCIDDGLQAAIHGVPRKADPSRTKITDEVSDQLIALSQNVPPNGFASWSLRLLADQMVELEYIERISHESVRTVLKKRREAPQKEILGYPA